MVKREAPMESLSSGLHDFLKKISENLSLPDKKFPRSGLIGLLRSGRSVGWPDHLPNQRTKFISRLDRPDKHLIKDSPPDDGVN